MKRHKPTADEGMQSLRDHVLRIALEARSKYGPDFELDTMLKLMQDEKIVRYPVRLSFENAGLQQGEFGFIQQIGDHPREGFILFIHPYFRHNAAALPLLIAYQLPVVNYGDIVSHVEAELFGAALLGLKIEDYYQQICTLADSI